MSLSPGARIGAFEIIEQIGAGGMGQVYRARDHRLDRDVALKVLPEHFTSDPDRLGRLEREAKVLASLNHPNIAHVYGYEATAIAMELVDGQTLDEVIRGSEFRVGGVPALPHDRALAIMRQIAAALEAAHDQGIIHRDLKPANVKVRDDGAVKVLDFGLAKAFAADPEGSAAVANSPTLTARSTQAGIILGTAAYMAPEQAKGRAVDRRADVWAFGAVYFEALSGRRAFDGDDVSEVLASVLKSAPDWNALPADLPAPVTRLLHRCLEKDPKRRLRDVAEGILQLDDGISAPASADVRSASRVESSRPLWRRALPVVVASAATAFTFVAVNRWRTPPPAPPPATMQFEHQTPASAPLFLSGTYRDLAISGDGHTVVYSSGGVGSGNVTLMVRRFDHVEVAPIRGAQLAVNPFISPDTAWVGFVDQTDQTLLQKISIDGGPIVPVTKARAATAGATWTDDGTIVFGVRGGPLYVVPDSGGDASPLTSFDPTVQEIEHAWPSAVPGTNVILFAIATSAGGTSRSGQLAAVDRTTGRVARLQVTGTNPRYLRSGHIVYASPDGSLRTVPFDAARMAVTGAPVHVLAGVSTKPSGAANFDISANGHLVYAGGSSTLDGKTIVWVDRTGGETPIAAPARSYFYARVSPDMTRLSLDVRDQEEDIWIWDLRRELLTRLTDKAGPDQYGLWTKDRRIVFSSLATGRPELFQHRPDGVGDPQRITDTTAGRDKPLVPFPNAITPDGTQVIFRAVVGSKNDLFAVNLTGDTSIRTLLATEHDERNAALSPDGRFMAFESDLSGRQFEVYVRPFPDVNAHQEKVSIAGGTEPVWSPRGGEIFYLADNKLMSVPVKAGAGATLELGKPVALFDTSSYFFGGLGRNYDVAPDGRRFVMVKNPGGGGDAPARRITIVLNWQPQKPPDPR